MIAPTAITTYSLFFGNKDKPRPVYDSFYGYACYLKQEPDVTNFFAWRCKEFDDFKEACKFALKGHRSCPDGTITKMPFKFVRISKWLPRAFHRRILKNELVMPIHTLFPDEE
jgi:hypothetical protein